MLLSTQGFSAVYASSRRPQEEAPSQASAPPNDLESLNFDLTPATLQLLPLSKPRPHKYPTPLPAPPPLTASQNPPCPLPVQTAHSAAQTSAPTESPPTNPPHPAPFHFLSAAMKRLPDPHLAQMEGRFAYPRSSPPAERYYSLQRREHQ